MRDPVHSVATNLNLPKAAVCSPICRSVFEETQISEGTELGSSNSTATEMAQDQELLRRLMRERMSTSGSEHKSPYAKVSSSGKIVCTVCPGFSIKSWSTHQLSAQHKRNVHAQKAAEAMPPPPPTLKKPEPPRKLPDPTAVAPKSILKNPLKAPSTPAREVPLSKPVPDETLKRSLPPSEDQPEAKQAKVSGEGTTLPEGFFDDPKLDAKARNIEYKDPQEVEWEMFQRELREEGSKSEQVVEIDEENDTRERELHEADEMISKWEKIRELEIRKDQMKKVDANDEQTRMEEDDEAEFAEFLDWRQKAVE